MQWLESISRTIRKPFGRTFSRDHRTRVRLPLPDSTSQDTITVGPYVRTEFPVECSDCGEEGHYFHQYTDTTGLFTSRELRCHGCYNEVYGDKKEIPMITDDGVDPTRSLVYDDIDPEDLFTEDLDDSQTEGTKA